ncbi:hypothetical protein [uncultured Bosea sp.]|uniref:hypothetical protein n=1 Tax=uncultured Bosea sp. TaxID=211457 RepID=UPI00263B7156|nr:hypothetical protein [uncultured Bosea sp.]
MLEAILGFSVRLVWFMLTQWIGYWTGRAAIQALSFGRLDVADLGYYNQKTFKPLWYNGRQPVVSFWIAIGLGQFLWFGIIAGAIVYLTRG